MVWVVMFSAFYFLNRKWGDNYEERKQISKDNYSSFTINISATNN